MHDINICNDLTPVIIYSYRLHLPDTTSRMEFLQFSKARDTSFSIRMSYSACLQIFRTNLGTSLLSTSIPFTNNVPCPLLAWLLVYCFPAYLFTCSKFKCQQRWCINKINTPWIESLEGRYLTWRRRKGQRTCKRQLVQRKKPTRSHLQ